MEVGITIRRLRIEKGIQQQELAGAVGISATSLSLIETGKKLPHNNTLDNIASALGVPVAMLFLLSLKREDFAQSKQPTFDVVYPMITSLFDHLI